MPLIDALARLSASARISAGSELAFADIRTHAVHGKMSPLAALVGMLVGTGLRAEPVGEGIYRLERIRHASPGSKDKSAPPSADIVVTATKRALPLRAVGGGIDVETFDLPLGDADARSDATALTARVPALSSTALGPGRNKLFLRGISDSSFTGRTQATLGEYLGEARINYNAPDPGLLLYDVAQIELLKGPQGTLYGGGTLGGILRIEPARPDLAHASGFLDTAGSTTQSGAPGYAVAGMANLPVVRDGVGTRVLAYRTSEGGYIDDDQRGKANVNRTLTDGARAQILVRSGAWTVDILATHQRIASRDSNYAEADAPELTRASEIAQPSRNVFELADTEIRGRIGKLDLTSTTSLDRNSLSSRYDASALAAGPASFDEGRRILGVSHETRLSHSTVGGGGWLLGVAALWQHERASQNSDRVDLSTLTAGYGSRQVDLSAFGQAALRWRDLLFTAGVRVTYSRVDARSDAIVSPVLPQAVHLSDFRPLPMAQLSWFVSSRLTASLGYRQGFRSGGVSIGYITGFEDTIPDGLVFFSYQPDFIRVADFDISYRTKGARPLTIEATLSGVDWSNVQTDLIDTIGFIATQNSGNAKMLNLDLDGSWEPTARVALKGGLSLTKGFFDYPPFHQVSEFASIPGVAAFADARWAGKLSADWTVKVEGRASYRSRSRLGPADLHDIVQGDVLTSALSASISHSLYSVSVTVDNIANDRSNLFAYGNPFTVRSGRQITPQRPRTATLAFHADF